MEVDVVNKAWWIGDRCSDGLTTTHPFIRPLVTASGVARVVVTAILFLRSHLGYRSWFVNEQYWSAFNGLFKIHFRYRDNSSVLGDATFRSL